MMKREISIFWDDGQQPEEGVSEIPISRPVLSVQTCRNNAHLIAEVAKLWLDPEDMVMEATWGRGKFWDIYQPEHHIWHDKYTLDGVDFHKLPEKDGSVDVFVFDCPYTATGGIKTSTQQDFRDRYGTNGKKRNQAQVYDDFCAGMKEGVRVLRNKRRGHRRSRMLVKCMNQIEGGKFINWYDDVLDIAWKFGLTQVDEFIHNSGTGPQPLKNLDGSPRVQQHARKCHSYLLVFEK